MHFFKDHLTVIAFAKEKGVSKVSVYRAIAQKKILCDYGGAAKIAFIHPSQLDKVTFKTSVKK